MGSNEPELGKRSYGDHEHRENAKTTGPMGAPGRLHDFENIDVSMMKDQMRESGGPDQFPHLPDANAKVFDPETGEEVPQLTVEEADAQLPPWYQQITVRAVLIGAGLGIFFSIVQQRLGLQAGVSPGFGLSSSIIGFGIIRFIVVPLMVKLGMGSGYYHVQETTVIQTTASSVLDLNWAGGFHSFLVALSEPVLSQFVGQASIQPNDAYNPVLGRIIPYQVCIGFIGIFVVLVLKKAMIIDFRLPWPSPTAAGVLIKSLHTKKGEIQAVKQLRVLCIALVLAFLWQMFEWFFSGGANGTCGFGSFPTFGLHAYKNTWYFDWDPTYVAIGILVPHIVNGSMMLGAVVIFGIVLPIAHQHKGTWYPNHLSSSKDVRGPYAYQVFGALALFLGEGAYTIFKVIVVACMNGYRLYKAKKEGRQVESARVFGRPPANTIAVETEAERRLSEYVFLHHSLPWWIGMGGYLIFTLIGTLVIYHLYPPAKWYYCLVLYIIAPFFSIINAYCTGMTDWDITSAWSTLGVLIVGAWAGNNPGAVSGALVMSGIAGAAVNAASSIMGDFKTGYYTLVHPRTMLAAQLIGEVIGLVMAPVLFYYLYYLPAINIHKPLGTADSQYQVPQAYVNLAAAIVSTSGISELPTHCFAISGGLFLFALACPIFRDFGPRKLAPYTPVPMAMGIPLVVGAWLAIDMNMGGIVKFVYQTVAFTSSRIFMVPAAAGVIAGSGVWAVPEAILALTSTNAPICMMFMASSAVPAS